MQSVPNQTGPRGAIPVMAVSCAMTVANIYICQPLLAAIATSFHASAAVAGHVVTAAQVGYALGILAVVPLADRIDPRRLLRILLALVFCGLLGAALSPTIQIFTLMALVVAAVTVVPQVLIPVAVAMNTPEQSGRVVGAMQTGLILGILLSQTAAGAIAQLSGTWRAAYLVSAVLNGALFFILARFMPQRSPVLGVAGPPYLALIASLPSLFFKWRDLRFSSILSALVFCSFTGFWATLSFHLAQAPFHFGPAQTGLFGLWGIVGALIVAPISGRLTDRFGPTTVNVIALISVALAYAVFFAAGDCSVLALIVGVNLLNFGNQSGQVANQARIFKLDPAARARLNTVYMVFTFAGGAIGSAIGAAAWTAGSWRGVCYAGFILIGLAACLLLARGVCPANRLNKEPLA